MGCFPVKIKKNQQLIVKSKPAENTNKITTNEISNIEPMTINKPSKSSKITNQSKPSNPQIETKKKEEDNNLNKYKSIIQTKLEDKYYINQIAGHKMKNAFRLANNNVNEIIYLQIIKKKKVKDLKSFLKDYYDLILLNNKHLWDLKMKGQDYNIVYYFVYTFHYYYLDFVVNLRNYLYITRQNSNMLKSYQTY